MGSLLAIAPPARVHSVRFVRELFILLGLAAIVFSCVYFTSTTPFPGLAALIPCCGTAMIIWSTSGPSFNNGNSEGMEEVPDSGRDGGTQPGLVERILTSSPLVGIGLISYSLYLWHWPLFSFNRHLCLVPASAGTRLLLMLAAFPLAIMSWRFVETPFRQRTVFSGRTSLFAGAATGSVMVLGMGLLVSHLEGIPDRISEKARTLAAYKDERVFHDEHTLNQVQAGAITRLGAVEGAERPTVLIWGDSLARAALPAWEEFCQKRDLSAGAVTHSATSPVLDYFRLPPGGHGLRERSPEFSAAVLELIRGMRPSEVVLIAHWESDEPAADHGGSCTFVEALKKTLRSMQNYGCRVWVMLQVPGHAVEVPRALMHQELYGFDVTAVSARPSTWNGLNGEGETLLRELADLGVGILDPRPLFLDSERGVYRMGLNGVPLYVDRGHLSPVGARTLVTPYLERTLPPDFGHLKVTAGR